MTSSISLRAPSSESDWCGAPDDVLSLPRACRSDDVLQLSAVSFISIATSHKRDIADFLIREGHGALDLLCMLSTANVTMFEAKSRGSMAGLRA